MGAEVAESANTAEVSVSHPSPIGIEPAAKRSAMADAGADSRDGAEMAILHLLAEGLHFLAASLEVTGLEDDFVVLEDIENSG